jgi:hypothetical protein
MGHVHRASAPTFRVADNSCRWTTVSGFTRDEGVPDGLYGMCNHSAKIRRSKLQYPSTDDSLLMREHLFKGEEQSVFDETAVCLLQWWGLLSPKRKETA